MPSGRSRCRRESHRDRNSQQRGSDFCRCHCGCQVPKPIAKGQGMTGAKPITRRQVSSFESRVSSVITTEHLEQVRKGGLPPLIIEAIPGSTAGVNRPSLPVQSYCLNLTPCFKTGRLRATLKLETSSALPRLELFGPASSGRASHHAPSLDSDHELLDRSHDASQRTLLSHALA